MTKGYSFHFSEHENEHCPFYTQHRGGILYWANDSIGYICGTCHRFHPVNHRMPDMQWQCCGITIDCQLQDNDLTLILCGACHQPATIEELTTIQLQALQQPKQIAQKIIRQNYGPVQELQLLYAGHNALYVFDHPNTHIRQVIKILRSNPSVEEKERFELECHILEELKQKNQLVIVTIQKFGQTMEYDETWLWMVMEYVPGLDMAQWLQQQKLSPHQALQVMLKIARVLSFVHQERIIHRDIKPANILIRDPTATPENITPLLTDFGIAKVLPYENAPSQGSHFHLTLAGLGTPQYMAPEQLEPNPIVSYATDIFALGIILYQMIAQKHPFIPEGQVSNWLSYKEATQQGMSPLPKDIHHSIRDILAKALDYNPQERYANASQFADDLEAFLDARQVHAFSWKRTACQWYYQHRSLAKKMILACILLVLALLVGMASYIVHHAREHQHHQAIVAICQTTYQEIQAHSLYADFQKAQETEKQRKQNPPVSITQYELNWERPDDQQNWAWRKKISPHYQKFLTYNQLLPPAYQHDLSICYDECLREYYFFALWMEDWNQAQRLLRELASKSPEAERKKLEEAMIEKIIHYFPDEFPRELVVSLPIDFANRWNPFSNKFWLLMPTYLQTAENRVMEKIEPLLTYENYDKLSNILSEVNIQQNQKFWEYLMLLESNDYSSLIDIGAIIARQKAVKVIPSFFYLLQDQRMDICIATIKVLVELKIKEAIPHLIRLLPHEDALIRMTVIQALAELQATEEISDIIPFLHDKDTRVRNATIKGLAQLQGKKMVSAIVPLLQDEDAGVRSVVVETLVGLQATEAIPQLTLLLQDQNTLVRSAVVKALAKLQGKEAIPFLLPLLQDNDATVRVDVITTLAKLKAIEAVPPLLSLLQVQDAWVCSAVIKALAELKGKKAIPDLLPLLQTKDAYVRSTIVKTLAALKANEAMPEILTLLQDQDAWVCSAAVQALVELKGKDAIYDLLPLLQHPHALVCSAVVKSLTALQTVEAVPHLLPLLQHPDVYVRTAVVKALTALKGKKAIPDILPLLKDQHGMVRSAVVQAWIELHDQDARFDLFPFLQDLIVEQYWYPSVRKSVNQLLMKSSYQQLQQFHAKSGQDILKRSPQCYSEIFRYLWIKRFQEEREISLDD